MDENDPHLADYRSIELGEMGRTAHAVVRSTADDSVMELRGSLHLIADDLAEGSFEQWTGGGVEALEAYLAKHTAFQTYLDCERDEASA
jgi:hypothetical protein